jgi:hypothetical protein
VAINQYADGIHDIGFVDGHIEPIAQFPYDEIDINLGLADPDSEPSDQPEQPAKITFQDAAAAWILLVEWIVGDNRSSFTMAAARAHTIIYWLSPDTCRFDSLQAISEEANCTRAALSKSLLELRDQLKIGFQFKRPGSREAYSECQTVALREGKHSSQRRRTSVKNDSN